MALLYEKASSLRSDGHRNYVHPADVRGRYDRMRKVAFIALAVLLAALPWIDVGGHPAVFLDVQHRSFYLFGATFNAQDFWLVFFLLSAIGYGLFVVTALWGRIWCGYACPQTVFLEGLFRPIERLIEGPRATRMRRNAGPWSWDKLWRKGVKHALYVLLSFLLAHLILSYFVSLPGLYTMVLSRPAEHPEAFVWAASLTGGLYFNFSWFREQLCLIVCPYGRLQSVMTDKDSLIIGYDERRGEPRGKASDPKAGDCVDCKRCVVVCPTGIDIRNGLQIDCIGCARCIDACDEVMVKLRRPTGLVRYDSSRGLTGKAGEAGEAGEARRGTRPRLLLYGVLGLLGIVAFVVALGRKRDFEANVLRLPGAPYAISAGEVRNGFQVHIVNKLSQPAEFQLLAPDPGRASFTIAMPRITLPSLGNQNVPIFVSFPEGAIADGTDAHVEVRSPGLQTRVLTLPLAAPHEKAVGTPPAE